MEIKRPKQVHTHWDADKKQWLFNHRKTKRPTFITVFFILIIFIPVSIKVFFTDINTEIIFPAEIMIGGLGLYFLRTFFLQKQDYIKSNFFRHPITYLVFAYFITGVLSCFFSSMPIVSLKALVVQVSYIMVFYFGAYMLMGKSNAMYYWNIMKLYGLALAAVVVYSFISQMGLGFNRSGASYASYPFFNDHTIYAATIVFVLPSFVCMCLFSPIFNLSYKERALFILLMILLIVSLFFSFCRAADISVIFLMLLLGFIKMKMRFNFFLLFAGVFTCGVVIFSGHIVEYFKKNKVDSNVKNAGFYEQVASVTNITTDASNAERINRWACSIRMFKDKPFVGFGPGTFQFKYIDYQVSNEQTYMSVKKPYDPNLIAHYYWSNGLKINSNRKGFRGRGGSAHSEYFLVLAEEGYFLYYFFYCSH